MVNYPQNNGKLPLNPRGIHDLAPIHEHTPAHELTLNQELPGSTGPGLIFHPPGQAEQILSSGCQVLQMEAEAILAVKEKIGTSFLQAINLLLSCQGKVVVTGIGKSGHIANKIAATFASTGTPAFFVHPAELRHGDFGMLEERDLIIALSGSGETQEIKVILDPLKRLGLSIIALTGNPESTLARHSNVVIDVGVSREACPLNLAPTSSTTVTLALGDALAIATMTQKGFRAEDFARSHPGGNLGRQLITVQDVMRSGVSVPAVAKDSEYQTILTEITDKSLGFTCVCNENGSLAGIITDGDIRRAQIKFGQAVFSRKAADIMITMPKTIEANQLAVEALKTMETHSISDLLIINSERIPCGVIHLKDLLRAGII